MYDSNLLNILADSSSDIYTNWIYFIWATSRENLSSEFATN